MHFYLKNFFVFGILNLKILEWIKVALKFKGFKNINTLWKCLLFIFKYEKKNINDNAWIKVVGEEYSKNNLPGKFFYGYYKI